MKKLFGFGKKGKYAPSRKESLKIEGPFDFNSGANILSSSMSPDTMASEPLIQSYSSFEPVIEQLNAIKKVEKETPDSNILPSKISFDRRGSRSREASSDTSYGERRESYGDHRESYGEWRENYGGQKMEPEEKTFRQTTIYTSVTNKSSLKMERKEERIDDAKEDANEKGAKKSKAVHWFAEDTSSDEDDDPFNQIRNQAPSSAISNQSLSAVMKPSPPTNKLSMFDASDEEEEETKENEGISATKSVGSSPNKNEGPPIQKRENEAFIEQMRQFLDEEIEENDEIEELLMSDSFNQPPPNYTPPILDSSSHQDQSKHQKDKNQAKGSFLDEDFDSSSSSSIHVEAINEIRSNLLSSPPSHEPLRKLSAGENKYQLSESSAEKSAKAEESSVKSTAVKKELPPVKQPLLKEPPPIKSLPPVKSLVRRAPIINISFDDDEDEREEKVEMMKDLKITQPVKQPESAELADQPQSTQPSTRSQPQNQLATIQPVKSESTVAQPIKRESAITQPMNQLTFTSSQPSAGLNQSVHDLVILLENERRERKVLEEKILQQSESLQNKLANSPSVSNHQAPNHEALTNQTLTNQTLTESALFKEKLALEERIFSLQSKIAKLSYDQELLSSDMLDLKRENSNLILIRDRLQSELSQVRDEKERLFKDKVRLQNESDNLSERLSFASTQSTLVDKETEERYHEVVKKNAELASEVINLKQTLIRNENDFTISKLDLQTRNDQLIRENERLDAELKIKDAQLRDAEEKLETLRKLAQDADAEKLSQLTLSIKELNSMVIRLDAKITNLNQAPNQGDANRTDANRTDANRSNSKVSREMVIAPEFDDMLASLRSAIERLDDIEASRRRLKDKEAFESEIDPNIFRDVNFGDADFEDAKIQTPKESKLCYTNFLSTLPSDRRPRSLFVKTLFQMESNSQSVINADDNFNLTGDAYLYSNQFNVAPSLSWTPVSPPSRKNSRLSLDHFYIAKRYLDQKILALKYDLGLYSSTLTPE